MEYAVWYTCVTIQNPRGANHEVFFRWSEQFGSPVKVERKTWEQVRDEPGYSVSKIKRFMTVN